jgi:Zn-dependent protease with chaperone function
MKRHIKKIITIALCMSMMQPALQATPFGEFCRKWVSRATNVAYWGILGAPIIGAGKGLVQIHEIREVINGIDKDGNPNFSELKHDKPELYREINTILVQEGLSSLDSHKIKVLPMSSYDTLGSLYLTVQQSPHTAADGTILVTETWLNNHSAEVAAAVLAHESVHADEKHSYKNNASKTVMPFAVHGLYRALMPAKEKYPSVVRSLARIPGAVGISLASTAAWIYNMKACEREADRIVKPSAKLSRSLGSFIDPSHVAEKDFEARVRSDWKLLQTEKPKADYPISFKIGYLMANAMNESQFVAFGKNFAFARLHPLPSERIAYLEQWAKEAEAKKQQEANK